MVYNKQIKKQAQNTRHETTNKPKKYLQTSQTEPEVP